MAEWSFITNYGLVLAAIARHPQRTARDLGDVVGITERATHRIITELEAAGYITKVKAGRRNEYLIHPDMPLRGKIGGDAAVRELLAMLGWKRKNSQSKAAPAEKDKG
ncbi:MAG: MarR family transcriptional regulator [Dehalococcoidia bacterium]|nr:MarR family transcriptional regulator [Dehalococcoidia bacterium]